ncbi:MAG: cobyrinate a,c-diamide synthase, partial [Thermoplasmataceae archaeon]
TLAILSKLPGAASFKIGPDYIDSGLASSITSRPTYNIDRWIQGRHYLDPLLRSNAEYGIIEGVMGYRDSGSSVDLSTHFYFEKLKIPYVLVVDVSRMAESAYYLSRGFIGHRTLGVILNNVGSERHGEMVEKEFRRHGVRVLASIPHIAQATIPERHLGLFTAADMVDLKDRVKAIASYIDTSFLEGIEDFRPHFQPESKPPMAGNKKIHVAVAFDRAFNFYYSTSMDFLNSIGEVEYFSPLKDEHIDDADLVYIGGGYPELYPDDLEKARKTAEFIRNHAESGKPLIAECGGLMYLENSLESNGRKYKMAGVFNGIVRPLGKLVLGYTKLIALESNFMFRKGEIIYGHEFHRTTIDDSGRKLMKNIIGKGIQDGMDGLVQKNSMGSYSHFDLSRYSRRLMRKITAKGLL